MDDKVKKFLEKIKDTEYVNNILKECDTECTEITLKIDGKPEPYARERKGRGGFYNPKEGKMNSIRKDLIHQLSKEEYDFTRELTKKDTSIDYYVELHTNYYIPIPKSTPYKDMVKMQYGKTVPGNRPDLDNYTKFLLDTLHNVIYDDDKRVVSSSERKLYSIEPRTEITVKIFKKK